VPATVQNPRWFFDENSIGVAQALQYVRGDVTWPGGPGGLVPQGAKDPEWLPVVGKYYSHAFTKGDRSSPSVGGPQSLDTTESDDLRLIRAGITRM
jgi:hypothetical protein